MRRSVNDPEWRDEVVRRWQRRRWKDQQHAAALADLHASLSPLLMWVDRQLRRSPRLYRWLSR